ncbi:PPOX class F420-dependent oxidoreductase [Streptomyces sp. BI20]|uniref:PPOX class F420-dependent oxidoreductase n=1 Tax=Streptomyces sp. BI20 TaxID=3403460 RepID=UPI003C747D86
MTTLPELGRARYVSLTTYRKDGTPVATPVWAAAEGEELFVWTRSDSWKVKRLSRNPAVTVRPCDLRGNVAEGAPEVTGTARLLTGPAEMKALRRLIRRKYGWQFVMLDLPSTLARGGKRPHTGIAIRAVD